MANQHIAFNVEGMTSQDCADKVKEALMKLNGIFDVIVDLNSKRVAVEYDEERLNPDIIRGTVEDTGYHVK